MIFVFVRCESLIRDGESYFSQHEVSSLEKKNVSRFIDVEVGTDFVLRRCQRFTETRLETEVVLFIGIEIRTDVVRNSWTQLEMDVREEKGWKIFPPREIVVPLQTSEIEINRSTTRG